MKQNRALIVVGILLLAFLGIVLTKKLANPSVVPSTVHVTMGKYPPHIVYRLQQMMKVHSFSPESQDILCKYFIKQDSLASMHMQQEGASSLLNEYYQTPVDELQGLISKLEFNDYKWAIASDRSSSLREVVYYREDLGLSRQKIYQLLLHSNEIEHQITTTQNFSKEALEFQLADSLLGEQKCIAYYKLKNQAQSTQIAGKWYSQLLVNNMLDTQADSIVICAELTEYESQRAALQDYWTKTGNEATRQETIAKNEQKKPVLLHQLEMFERMPVGSISKEALLYKEHIKLSNTQIKSLYQTPVQLDALKLEKDRMKEKYIEKCLEYSLAKKILTSSQIESVLTKRFEKKVNKDVEAQIRMLKKNNLIQEEEYQKTTNLLYDYLMNYNIARALVGLENSREHVFRKHNLESNKPAILNTLEKLWTQELQKHNKAVQF